MPVARMKVTFAGITFSAVGRGGKIDDYATVPKPALIKILNSGKVKVVCNYNHSDEACYRHPTGEADPKTLLPELEEDYVRLITYNVKEGTISFSPHTGKGYTITQV